MTRRAASGDLEIVLAAGDNAGAISLRFILTYQLEPFPVMDAYVAGLSDICARVCDWSRQTRRTM